MHELLSILSTWIDAEEEQDVEEENETNEAEEDFKDKKLGEEEEER